MAEHPGQASFQVTSGEPLIGVPCDEDGHQITRYFSDEAAAAALDGRDVTTDALNLAGAWSDLDFDEMVAALDRIRHESTPSPPVDLDL